MDNDSSAPIPDKLLFISSNDCAHSSLVQQLERGNRGAHRDHIIVTHSPSDVKFAFNFLCNKIQKYCHSNLTKTSILIRIALIGSDAYVNSFLRCYVDCLSTKSPDWQSYLRFFIIPPGLVTNSMPTTSSLLYKYLSSIDHSYVAFFKDWELRSEASSARDDDQLADELVGRVNAFLDSAQVVIQIPIAEAMVTYKDRHAEDADSNQVFIPFICDAKIGMLDSSIIFGNQSSLEAAEESNFFASPSNGQSQATSQVNDKNIMSPVSNKDPHASLQLTPPNSPNVSALMSKDSGSHSRDVTPVGHMSQGEAIDLQIDYWTVAPKLSDNTERAAPSFANIKRNESSKFTLKSSFRNLQISRLPCLGELNSPPSLTLYFITKEKKQKSLYLRIILFRLF